MARLENETHVTEYELETGECSRCGTHLHFSENPGGYMGSGTFMELVAICSVCNYITYATPAGYIITLYDENGIPLKDD